MSCGCANTSPCSPRGWPARPSTVLLNPPGPDHIPVVATNRGGQVTYHGPGQVVAYPLLDLRQRGYFVKEYVHRIEEAVIRTLMHFGVTGHRVASAPGIYVRLNDPFAHAALTRSPPTRVTRFGGLGKVAALGIKVTRHCTYHGVSLNVDMDLSPFDRINPCGYQGLATGGPDPPGRDRGRGGGGPGAGRPTGPPPGALIGPRIDPALAGVVPMG